MEKKIKEVMKYFNISNETMYLALLAMMKNNSYKPFIESVLNADDFLLFKKMMIKKNKQLENETYEFMKNYDID